MMIVKDKWYSPGAIKFTKTQIKWLIPRLPSLRNGEYPHNPKESGYSDFGGGKPQFKAGAKFEVPAGIAAELDIRLQRAGVDGILLELLYAGDPDDELFVIEHIANCLKVDSREISQRIRNALYFVSGIDRKAGSYSKYIRGQYYKYLRVM